MWSFKQDEVFNEISDILHKDISGMDSSNKETVKKSTSPLKELTNPICQEIASSNSKKSSSSGKNTFKTMSQNLFTDDHMNVKK